MTNRRILIISFVVAAAVVFIVLRQLFDFVFDVAQLGNRSFGPMHVSDLVTAVVTLAAAVGLWRYPRVMDFLSEVVDETSKVVWPSRQETRDSTVVVIVFVFVVAGILGGFDLAWAKLTNLILSSSVS